MVILPYIVLVVLLIITGVVVYYQLRSRLKRTFELELAAFKQQQIEKDRQLAELTLKLKDKSNTVDVASLALLKMPMGLICFGTEQAVIYANEYARTFFDKTGQELSGLGFKELVNLTSVDGTSLSYLLNKVLEGTKSPLPPKALCITRNGKIPVRGVLQPVFQAEKAVGFLLLFEDISQQSREADEQKALLSSAAHELRTPLSVIRANVSVILENYAVLPPEKIQEMLKSTDESAADLLQLVDDFLNLSRIEQGRLEVEMSSFDLVAFTKELVTELSPLARARKLYLQQNIEFPGLPHVFADKTKVKEIISNLISNALKYTHQGGITITHTLEDSTLVTRVTDTGIGIPKDNQVLLFRQFQKTASARGTSSGKSTGFGLYISQKMARLMKGDVLLEKSEPGAGSTFVLRLSTTQPH